MPESSVRRQLELRARAARRLPPLPGRQSSAALCLYDPIAPAQGRQPSTFSLSATELRREVQRLLATGWQVHEVAAVLVAPEGCSG